MAGIGTATSTFMTFFIDPRTFTRPEPGSFSPKVGFILRGQPTTLQSPSTPSLDQIRLSKGSVTAR